MPALKSPHVGFNSNNEYLDAECRWARFHSHRLSSERSARIALEDQCLAPPRQGRPTAGEARLQAVAYREQEDRARKEIDGKLAAGRKPKSFQLGIDVLCGRHELSQTEREILLFCTLASISAPFAESTLPDHVSLYSACSVSDLCALLEARTIGEWLRLRKLFVGGKLESAGLIEIATSSDGVAALGAAEVKITQAAFDTITSDAGEKP